MRQQAKPKALHRQRWSTLGMSPKRQGKAWLHVGNQRAKPPALLHSRFPLFLLTPSMCFFFTPSKPPIFDRHRVGVLPCNSVLTLPVQSEHRPHWLRAQSHKTAPYFRCHLQIQVVTQYLRSTSYKSGVPTAPSSGSMIY